MMYNWNRETALGPMSLWARASGYAEGTRSLNGGFLPPYFGHEDPLVKGRSNYGSFSSKVPGWDYDLVYQERSAKALKPLIQELEPEILKHSDPLYVELAIMDLWVQSPAAVLGWNDSSLGLGIRGAIAFLPHGIPTMRIECFRNANGELETGFTEAGLLLDQSRRAGAIASVLHWTRETGF